MIAKVLDSGVADDLDVLPSDYEEGEFDNGVWLKAVCGEQLNDVGERLVRLLGNGGWC